MVVKCFYAFGWNRDTSILPELKHKQHEAVHKKVHDVMEYNHFPNHAGSMAHLETAATSQPVIKL